jgi:thiol-disulfide isomerase/thioredoxin
LNNVFVIGPFVLPYALLLMLAAVASSLFVGQRIGRKSGVEVKADLWRTLLVGVVVARLAFVLEFLSAYFASPLAILDLRDGGWSATPGFVAAWLFALSQHGRRPALRRPLQSALITGSAIWLVGSIALSVRPDTGQELPTLSFASLEGPMVSLAQFKGQPTVVNLWATWCPPCVHEMPVLQQAQTDYPDVNFVFVNQRESPDKVDAWLRARRLTLRNMLLDTDGQTAAAFKQRALPMTLFFNQRGRLVSARIGELSSATLTERLDGLRSE